VIPEFDPVGKLPAGIHEATWKELAIRYGTTAHRRRLLDGLMLALESLRDAGCTRVYINGSFVTAKNEPGDFDACWEAGGVDSRLLDPVLLDFSDRRRAQKARFSGELFPAEVPAEPTGTRFLDYFQQDKTTGARKGIVALELKDLA
jgi:hypothetical protein